MRGDEAYLGWQHLVVAYLFEREESAASKHGWTCQEWVEHCTAYAWEWPLLHAFLSESLGSVLMLLG
jgi:hypothetical protein